MENKAPVCKEFKEHECKKEGSIVDEKRLGLPKGLEGTIPMYVEDCATREEAA